MNEAFERLVRKVAGSQARVAVPCESREQAERLRDRYYYERRKLRAGAARAADGPLLELAETISARVEEEEGDWLVVFSARRDMLEEMLEGVL